MITLEANGVLSLAQTKLTKLILLSKQKRPCLTIATLIDLAEECSITYKSAASFIQNCRNNGINTNESIVSMIRIYKPEHLCYFA